MIFPADYTITLSDNSIINLLFNTYFFTQYSEAKKVEYEDLIQSTAAGETIKYKDLPLLFLMAHKTYCIYNKQPFDATEAEACMWIDELGGIQSPTIVSIWKEYVFKMSPLSRAEFDAIWDKAIQLTNTPVEETDKKKEAA